MQPERATRARLKCSFLLHSPLSARSQESEFLPDDPGNSDEGVALPPVWRAALLLTTESQESSEGQEPSPRKSFALFHLTRAAESPRASWSRGSAVTQLQP